MALARVLADPTWLPVAGHLLQLGRARLRGNPLVLCESGVLAELMATDPAFEADARRQLALKADGPGRPLSPMAFTDLLKRRAYYLSQAADWLGQAATGSSDMCRLHLGRVLSLTSSLTRRGAWTRPAGIRST